MSDLLTRTELAAHYKVTTRTIDRWTRQGMPYESTPSGSPRFRIKEVQEWCNAKQTKGE